MSSSSPSQARLRYGLTIIGGALVDLGGSFALATWAGLPLQLAAAIGFCTALALNYLLFEFWAFAGRHSSISLMRIAKTVAAALVALGVRLVVITALGAVLGASPIEKLVRLGAAMGASVLVNYAVVSRVFRRID